MPPLDPWPDLPLASWADTQATLHLQTQVVGKVKLRCAPLLPHWWGVTLFVTPTGLTTGSFPYGPRTCELRFDLVRHELVVDVSDGRRRVLPLGPRSVADFHRELFARLRELDCDVTIDPRPVEIPWTTPLDRDEEHAAWDTDAVDRFRRALVQAARVLEVFRSWFLGKASPVHFFWGSFDLAVTRFSGRPAPPHPGGVPNLPDWVVREAYRQEVSSAGWWPGGAGVGEPAFYSYAWPEPAGFARAHVAHGRYQPDLREFVLPWSKVRTASDPDTVILAFLQDAWRAAADLGGWDPSLERAPDDLGSLARRIGVRTPLPPEPVV